MKRNKQQISAEILKLYNLIHGCNNICVSSSSNCNGCDIYEARKSLGLYKEKNEKENRICQ